MIYLIQTFSDIAQQTFKTCFSPRSYLRGNTLTNELTLHLIPFDHIDQINDYNQCKTALDKMNVLIYLHFDTVSFPRPADPKVYFRYQFNTPIDVVFPLSDADYNSILDKPTAVFELRYDISYVIVNGSVSIVEHTKYNGTGCFADIQMVYDTYGDIDILTTPNNCYVDFAAGVTVSFDYTYKSQNKQIPIYSCSSGCVDGEYNATSLTFQDITTYRVKKTPGLATKFADFYTAFVENRLIKMSLNIRFDTNGVQQTITQFIDDKTAADTLGCLANDLQTPTYFGLQFFTQLNSDGIVLQIRDVLKNKMNCDTLSATQIKLDHYMIEGNYVDRRQLSMPLDQYNELIGLAIPSDISYQNFRSKIFINGSTHSLIIISFQDANGQIIYELCSYIYTAIGCYLKSALHLYENKQCLRIVFDPHLTCQQELLNATDRNSIAIYYQNGIKYEAVGQYDMSYMVNYAQYGQELCYDCNQYDDTQSYVGSSCAENTKQLKQKLTNQKITFIYTSAYEQIISDYVITEYQSIWVHFIITTVMLIFAIFIAVVIIWRNSLK
ncbi:Conserved_hypothetical protein [Hexamita inflata]|uniref:Transmembrane protein n=1 Tax=Hexamita inflata TaxID=28002 RepID=A0AA86PMG3_9EUKA|nr:Conserved hypothetical protein [Hexamita inflata]